MDVDRAFLDKDAMPPDKIKKLRPAEHPPGAFHQDRQKAAFLWPKRHQMAGPADLHRRLVEAQVMEFENVVGKRRMGAPQQRAHAADHLTWREWLGDVVIGANIEAKRAIAFLAARTEDDDGKMLCLGAGAQRPADIDPRHLRHHPVNDGEVRAVLLDHFDRLLAILGAKHLIIGLNQIVGQQFKLVGLIIGNENTDRHLYPSLSTNKAVTYLP